MIIYGYMFRLLLSHPQAPQDKDPRISCVYKTLRDPQRFGLGIPQCFVDTTNSWIFILGGPEDDSLRVETCSHK